MSFLVKHLKKFQLLWAFFVFSSFISCQSLDQVNKSNKINFYVDKKNQNFRAKADLQKKHSPPQLINQNYFEIQADSAYLKGEEAFFKGDNEKALSYFKTAILFAPNSSHLRQRLASIYEQEGLFAEALSHYQFLLQKEEQNKAVRKKLTDIYALKGLNSKAFEHHQYLLAQDPNDFSLWFKQAYLLANQKDWSSALKALQQAEKRALSLEEKVQVLLSKSYILARLKKPSESLKTMNQLSELPIYEERLALRIASLYETLGQDALALSYLEKFQSGHSVSTDVAKALLDHYISFKNWEKALKQMEKIQSLGQLENYHYFYMAVLLLEKQKYDQALVFLKDLVTKDPKNGQYLYLLAGTYEKKKNWHKALSIYNKVKLSSTHFLIAQLQSAQLLKQMGKKKKSFALLKKLSFSKKGKISPQALLLYAESLWNEGEQNKALDVLSRGLKAEPFHTDILFLRGFYLKQQGHLDLALKDMNQILKKQKDHKEALNFIASSN